MKPAFSLMFMNTFLKQFPFNYKENSKFEVSPNFFKDIKGTHTYNFSNGLLVLDFLKTSKNKTK